MNTHLLILSAHSAITDRCKNYRILIWPPSLHSRSTVHHHHHHQSISKAKATGSIQNKKRFHSSIRLHQHHQHQHLLKRRWKESSSEKRARMIITLQHNTKHALTGHSRSRSLQVMVSRLKLQQQRQQQQQ